MDISGDVNGPKADNLAGGDGNDVIGGLDRDDTLSGNGGEDALYGDSGNDWLYGGALNDTLSGGDDFDKLWGGLGTDLLFGGLGNDTLHGDANNDVMTGDENEDVLYGDAGNDLLNGDVGNDWLYGGTGLDTLNGGAGSDHLYGGADQDLLKGDASLDTLRGGDGDDNLFGGTGNDKLYGEGNDDTLYGDAGRDWLDGGTGNDLIFGHEMVRISVNPDDRASDTLMGGLGQDTLIGGLGADKLFGGSEDDNLYGHYLEFVALTGTYPTDDGASDSLYGGSGNDYFEADDGDDLLSGGSGVDVADYSRSAADVTIDLRITQGQTVRPGETDTLTGIEDLLGGNGNDVLRGSAVSNELYGGDGGDTLFGFGGDDVLVSGKGDDQLSGGTGNDVLDGGEGTDLATYEDSKAAVRVDLSITGKQNTMGAGIDQLNFVENLRGSQFSDTLIGDDQANDIDGGIGSVGATQIIIGGSGADTLHGGLAFEDFVYRNVSDSTVSDPDLILGFQHLTSAINLSRIDANIHVRGNQAFEFTAGPLSAGKISFEAGLLVGDVDGDGAPDFAIRIQGVLEMSDADFIL